MPNCCSPHVGPVCGLLPAVELTVKFAGQRSNVYSLAPPAAASAVCRAMSPPDDGRYPVMRMSGPEGCHCTSTNCRACVISTLPSSPTGEGARTPPTCSKWSAATVRPAASLSSREGGWCHQQNDPVWQVLCRRLGIYCLMAQSRSLHCAALPPTNLGAMKASALCRAPPEMAGAASMPPHSQRHCRNGSMSSGKAVSRV